MGQWIVNGVDLSTYAWNVVDRAAGWSVPGRKGENTDMPNMHGKRYVPNKTFTAGKMSLSMWALGCLPDGTFPASQTRAWQCRENLQQLAAVFSQPGLSDVRRIESKGYGAVNQMTNPNSEGYTLGPVAYANEVTNPAMAAESLQVAYSDLFVNPEVAPSTTWTNVGNNLVPDPDAKRYRANAATVIEKNWVGQASWENYAAGTSIGGSWVAGAGIGLTVQTSTALVGTHSLQVLASGAITALATIASRTFSFPTGSTPHWRFGVRRVGTGSTTRTVGYRFNYCDSTNTIVTSGTWQSVTLPTAGAWTEVTIPRSFFASAMPAGATVGMIEFRAGEAWASGEGVFLDKLMVGDQPGISAEAGPWFDGDSLWASWTSGVGNSISQFDSVVDADWTVDAQTSAYYARAVCGNDVTGTSLGFIAFGNSSSGTQTFTLPVLTGDVGRYYTLSFLARALSGVTATVDLMYSDSGGPMTSGGPVSVVGSGTATSHNMTGTAVQYWGPTILAQAGRQMYVRVSVPVKTNGNQQFQFTELGVTSYIISLSGDAAATENTRPSWEGTPYQSRTLYGKHLVPGFSGALHSSIANGTNTMTHDIVELIANYPNDPGGLVMDDIPADLSRGGDGCYLTADMITKQNSRSVGSARAVVEAWDATGVLLGTYTGVTTATGVNSTGTQPFTTISVLVPTLPDTTAVLRCHFDLVGAGPGTILWVKNVMLVNRSGAVAFFSGDTPTDSVYDYVWSGAADNSVSHAKAVYPSGYRAVVGIPVADIYAGQGMVLYATNKVDGPTIEVSAVLPAGAVNVGVKVSADVEANVFAQLINGNTVLAEAFLGIVSPAPFLGGSVQSCQGVLVAPSPTTHVRFLVRHSDNSVWPLTFPVRQARFGPCYVYGPSGNPRQDGNRLLNWEYVRGTVGWTAGTPPTVDLSGTVITSSVAFGTEIKATGKQTLTNLGHIPCVSGDTVFGWVKARASKNWNLQASWYSSGGTLLSTSTLVANTTAGTQTVSGTATAPASTAYARLRVQLTSVVGTDTLEVFRAYATAVVAGRDYSTTLDPSLWRYVDGATVDWLGRSGQWEGTKNASRTLVASAAPTGWDSILKTAPVASLVPPGSEGRLIVVDPADVVSVSTDWPGFGSGFSLPPTSTSGVIQLITHPVTADAYLSGEVAIARRDSLAEITLLVYGYLDELRAGPVLLGTVTATADQQVLSFNDIPCSTPWWGLELDYTETEVVTGGIAVAVDNVLMASHPAPWAADYPGYFDGDTASGQWNGTRWGSSSTYFAGGLQAFCERLEPIDPTSQAGGTRAEMDVSLEIPAAFWQDLVQRTVTVQLTGVPVVLDLDDFAGTTAPIEDTVVTVRALSGAGPLTSLTLTDVASGAWLTYGEQVPQNGTIVINCGTLSVMLNKTVNKIRKVTRGGPARFLTFTAPAYNQAPKLQISGAGLFDGILQVSVTGRRKFLVG